MKKIVFLYHTSVIGGGSFCLLNILKNLDRNQIEPHVLLCNDGPLVAEIKNLGISVDSLPLMHTVPYNESTLTPRNLHNALDIIRSIKDFKKIVYRLQPDVVYCNTMMLYPYLKPAKECGCKTIIHIREHWPEGEHSWQRATALKHIAKYADNIVAINQYSASMVAPYGRQATIVYDWIDMSARYQPMSLDDIFGEDMSDKKVFLYMGGLQSIKGAYEVVRAFVTHLKDPNFRLLALGINPEYNSSGLKGLLKKCLSAIGRVPYSDKVIRLVKTDARIKCIPGLYNIRHLYEQAYCIVSYFTIPHANLALAESIICNTMNVAAKTDESLEYSYEGKLALLYEENNFDDFVCKLQSIEDVREEYLSRMKQDSNIIATLFSPEVNISVLNNILKTI